MRGRAGEDVTVTEKWQRERRRTGGAGANRILLLYKREGDGAGEGGTEGRLTSRTGGGGLLWGQLWGQTPITWLPALFACLSCFQLNFIQKFSKDQI